MVAEELKFVIAGKIIFRCFWLMLGLGHPSNIASTGLKMMAIIVLEMCGGQLESNKLITAALQERKIKMNAEREKYLLSEVARLTAYESAVNKYLNYPMTTTYIQEDNCYKAAYDMNPAVAGYDDTEIEAKICAVGSLVERQVYEISRLTDESQMLAKEVTNLAIESVEREKKLAKLEAEVQCAVEQYRQQEAEGLLVRLPFPIGSKVYCVNTEGVLKGSVIEQIVHDYSKSEWQGQINKGKDNRFVICHNSYNHPQAWQLCDVYATREEADQAKAGMGDRQ